MNKISLKLLATVNARLTIAILTIYLFSAGTSSNAQSRNGADDKKRFEAARTTLAPRIDGIMDEPEWQKSNSATDFIIYIPDNGAPSRYKTDVRILYDDNALYVGALMYDDNPDSIYIELGERDADRMLNADNFSVEVSPYNDGVNGFRFKVSASGVQSDSRVELFDFGMGGGGSSGGGGGGGGGIGPGMTGGGSSGGSMGRQDNWDAVWDSEVSINDKGWVAELRIPYSALRFPKETIQEWGINFWREVRRTREQSSWNAVDRTIGSTINHLGEMVNITNIKPPLRLSMTPYVSGYLEKTTGEKSSFTYNGGLDMKIGLNESFTIDATLVPDFGQVQSDDQILNLTPYEVRYNEKRPFFMEGTELFNKGEIFYSRRVGARPRMYYDVRDQLNANEKISSNPQEAYMVNATKLSGRTRTGLGIGVFNAMTKDMYAVVEDTITGETRHIKTEPFTNFNMLVLDQNLRNNSYFSIVNTNVWRNHAKDDNYYTANVTGTDFMLRNKSRMYSISGRGAISQKYYDSAPTDLGHYYFLRGGKTGGAFRVEYQLNAISETYDPNDMGYLRRNNELENEVTVSYNVTRPVWKINSTRNSIQYGYSQLYSPRAFTQSQVSLSSSTIFRNFWNLNLRAELRPQGINDYYEPRVDGRFYHKGSELETSVSIETNRNKKFFIGGRVFYTGIKSDYDQSILMYSINPGIRVSNRFSINHQFAYMSSVNDIGYVNDDETTGEIFFGKRNNKTYTNTLTTGYIFTAKSYLTFRLRHYWSVADYTGDYYLLNNDGSLDPNTPYSENHDDNFNTFNIDMVYNWRFAPGSDISVVWKNSIYSSTDYIFHNFRDDLEYMFEAPQTNSISLKILYYLDYQYLKKRK
jgi:hypothetical protein